MTQADNTSTVLGRSLERASGSPAHTRPYPAPPYSPLVHGDGGAKWTPPEELPRGWTSFYSRPDPDGESHWYATAPWNVDTVRQSLRTTGIDMPNLGKLSPTVEAPTWDQLKIRVGEQIDLYDSICADLR